MEIFTTYGKNHKIKVKGELIPNRQEIVQITPYPECGGFLQKYINIKVARYEGGILIYMGNTIEQ